MGLRETTPRPEAEPGTNDCLPPATIGAEIDARLSCSSMVGAYVVVDEHLAEILLASLSPRLHPSLADLPETEARLRALWHQVRSARPLLSLDAGVFLPYLAQRLEEDLDLAAALARVRAEDLYLACGCALREAAALEELEVDYLGRIGEVLARFREGEAFVEEVKGQTRDRLLYREPPKILEYGGRGSLARWLRAVVTRLAIDLRRQRQRRRDGDDALLETPATGPDPELQFLKGHYQELFREIFQDAMAALTAPERLLLRQHYLDGMSIDRLGALYQVHRGTAARRLAKARGRLLTETRQRFRERIGVQRTEFESLMRMVRSQLHLTLPRMLDGD